jgi:hypothetical protein
VWGSRTISINVHNNRFFDRPQFRDRYHDGNWQHVPEHRRGVAYRDPALRERYQHYDSRAVDARRDFRGNDYVRQGGGNRPGNGEANRVSPGGSEFRQSRPSGGVPPRQGAENQARLSGAPRPGDAANARPGGNSFNRPTGPQNASRPSPNIQTQRPSPTFNQASAIVNQRDARAQVQQQSNRGQASREALTRPAGGDRPAGASRPAGGERGGGGGPGRGERPAGGGGKPGGEGGDQRGHGR